MVAILQRVLKNCWVFGKRRNATKRRVRRDDYEILNILGREQLERLKKKGLSIPVVAT